MLGKKRTLKKGHKKKSNCHENEIENGDKDNKDNKDIDLDESPKKIKKSKKKNQKLKKNKENINNNFNKNNYINENPNTNQINSQNNLLSKTIINNKILFKNVHINKSTIYRKNKNPKYMKIFVNINIFNSVLIMINNISFINNYFIKKETINKINSCEKNNKFCLSSILYNINKYLWNSKTKKSENDLLKKFTKFTNSQMNSLKSTSDKYYYEIKNIESIIKYIYTTINEEFTEVKTALQNNINTFEQFKDSFDKFIVEFSQKHKSIISDHFYGFYQFFCQNCKYTYDSFCYINFNLNEIKKVNLNQINFRFNNILENINLNDCFNYYFPSQNKIKYCNSFCNICKSFTCKEIFTLPNILTIILSNNDNNNYNFVLQDELNLNNFSKKVPNNSEGKYMLISILCKNIYNDEFICYCINPNNGLWYSYTNGNIKNVTKMDINAIPLVLFYQIKNSIEFIYENIQRYDLNKIKINVKIMNGIPSKELFFNKNDKIKNIKNEIISYFNLGNISITMVVDGKILQDNRFLYEVINTNNEILVFI